MQNKVINHVKCSNRKKISVYQLNEPYEDEMDRLRLNELSSGAKHFATSSEAVSRQKVTNDSLTISKFNPLVKNKSKYYSQYIQNTSSPSMGMVLTNIDLSKLKKDKDGKPVLWQMGPQRIKLALAQRALFFDDNQNETIHKIIDELENGKNKILPRANKSLKTVETALGIDQAKTQAVYTPAISELGYKKISTNKLVSRKKIAKDGLFNYVGKYPRKIIGLGAMPPVTGWLDAIVLSAIGHMVSFIPRSNIYANDLDKRIRLATEAKKIISSLKLKSEWVERAQRNIGAALGPENPKEELKTAKRLVKEAGVKLFRIYTIGSDQRVTETAKLLRQHFGKEIEIIVGQIADKKQALKLISKDIAVDGLIFGHGGGQQCTSAINGMAITTLEDVYEITLDRRFNKTSILVEGGIGRSMGTALILGVDCCLGNQKFIRGTIETGNLFVQDRSGKICQPYPGTASPVTQLIESQDVNLRHRRIDAAGRTYFSEGKPGLMYYEAKAGSMVFWINEYLRHAARTLADLGVNNITELRSLLAKSKDDYLRIISEKTQYLSGAHWNYSL